MNKNQLIMAVIGGVALVAVLGVGYFIYDQSDTRDEAQQTLDAQVSIFNQTQSFKPATREQEAAHKKNIKELKDWIAAATAAATGLTNKVRYAEEMTPSDFHKALKDDVRHFESLPEDAAEADKIFTAEKEGDVFPDFKSYIVDGNTPTPDVIATLRRQWGDIYLVVDTLVEAGALKLESVKIDPKGARQVVEQPDPKARNKSAKEAKPVEVFDIWQYEFVFTARQEALVAVLNALAKVERFVSVDELSFKPETDELLSKLTGSTKKREEQRSGRRRSRVRVEEETPQSTAGESAETVARSGVVTHPANPQLCKPFRVTMTLSTLIGKVKEEKK